MKPLPVLVLTGFLGAGKTSLARRWLASPGVSLIVNEVGAVEVDEGLRVDERLSTLPDGCACCATREDLVEVVGAMLDAERAPSLLILETSGLADPGPILSTLLGHDALAGRLALRGVLTVVDAVRAPVHLKEREARTQIALADAVLLSKVDAATGAQVEAAEDAVRGLRRDLVPLRASTSEVDLQHLLEAVDAARAPALRFALLDEPHSHDVVAHSLRADAVDGQRLLAWLRGLSMVHGPDVMRIKGCVQVAGLPIPLRLQGVHDHLEANPAADVRAAGSALVIIGRGLDPRGLQEGFASCEVGRGG